VRDWLPAPPPVDRAQALAELARRYLRGHGPADERDLAIWSGLALRDVRAGLNAIASEIEQRRDGLLDLAGQPAPGPLASPRLLGAFDPVLLGWRSREWIVGPHQAKVTSGGVFRPLVMVAGHAAGTWGMPNGAIVLKPFGRISAKDGKSIAADAEDVMSYLAGARDLP
jgi:Winged helix DNA-binding domain